MATVVDSLVVRLGLDPKGFVTGQRQALVALKETEKQATATAKSMVSRGSEAAEFFSKIKGEALGLIAVLGGAAGAGAVVKSTADNLASLGRAARNIGIAVPQLAAFRMAVQANGGSADAAAESLKNLTDQMEEFNATGRISDTFKAGLQVIGGRKGEGPMEILADFARYAAAHKGQQALINLVGRRLGLDQGSINEVSKGPGQFGADMADAMKDAPTQKMTENAAKLQAAFEKLWQAITSVKNKLIDDYAPMLTRMLTGTRDWIEANKGLAEQLLAVGTALSGIAGVVGASAILKKLFGIGGGAEAAEGGGLMALLGRLSLWLSVLSLGGDTPQGPQPQEKGLQWFFRGDWLPSFSGRASNDHTTGPGAGSYALGSIPSDVESEIRTKARAMGLDEDHMVRLARAEGGGYNNVSPDGAIGPMQLMPGTAIDMGVNPYDWHQNITGGLKYYQQLLRQFGGNKAAADAAYNAGPFGAGVQHFGTTGDPSLLPNETQRYINSINGGSPGAVGQQSNNSSNVSIGTLVVNSAAKDATGIAGDIKSAIRRQMLVPQANTGLA